MLYVSHVTAKPVCVTVLHSNIHDVVSASDYRRSRIRVCVLLRLLAYFVPYFVVCVSRVIKCLFVIFRHFPIILYACRPPLLGLLDA